MSDEERGRRGPKRSQQSRLAILTAAFELIREAGYRGLTIEGIATRAGVGKQTVYRWWPTKADVLLEAAATKADLHVSTTDRGAFRDDLEQFLRDSFRLLRVPGLAELLRSLMADSQINPEFAQRFREGFLNRRRAALVEIVERAQMRGDAPAGTSADLVADVVFGFIWYRVMATERSLEDADIVALLRLLAPTGIDPEVVAALPDQG